MLMRCPRAAGDAHFFTMYTPRFEVAMAALALAAAVNNQAAAHIDQVPCPEAGPPPSRSRRGPVPTASGAPRPPPQTGHLTSHIPY